MSSLENTEQSQPVEITEIEEEELDSNSENSRNDVQSIDSEKQALEPVDLEEHESTPTRIYVKQEQPAPSRSPPAGHQFIHTSDGRQFKLAVKRGSSESQQHMIISDSQGQPVKVMLKNVPATGQILVSSAQMNQILQQQNSIEGAQALIALQQQQSLQSASSFPNINHGLVTSSKRPKFGTFSSQNSQMSERSTNSPQLSVPKAKNEEINFSNGYSKNFASKSQNNSESQSYSQQSDFSAPTYIEKQQKSGEISSFIHKINKMIELAEKDHQYWTTDNKYALIHWNEDGRHFIIHEPDVFTKKLIPTHFRHQKLPSFIRQLNQYGFKKLNRMEHDNFMKYKSEYFEYYHESFHRDKPEDWHKVKRRRNDNLGSGGSQNSESAAGLSKEKIQDAYLAGINAGRVEAANQQVNPVPTIIKQISVQDNEEFQNLQHAFNQLKSEQEFIAGQMVAIKSQNSLLANDNHILKKENKSLKLQINNLWREVSEMKDTFLQQRTNSSHNEAGSKKPKMNGNLAADLDNSSMSPKIEVDKDED